MDQFNDYGCCGVLAQRLLRGEVITRVRVHFDGKSEQAVQSETVVLACTHENTSTCDTLLIAERRVNYREDTFEDTFLFKPVFFSDYFLNPEDNFAKSLWRKYFSKHHYWQTFEDQDYFQLVTDRNSGTFLKRVDENNILVQIPLIGMLDALCTESRRPEYRNSAASECLTTAIQNFAKWDIKNWAIKPARQPAVQSAG